MLSTEVDCANKQLGLGLMLIIRPSSTICHLVHFRTSPGLWEASQLALRLYFVPFNKGFKDRICISFKDRICISFKDRICINIKDKICISWTRFALALRTRFALA
jgi:hypothetical protein